MDDNSDSSLEKKIANPDLEYKVDQEDEQLRKKKLSLTTSIALAILGFIVLGTLILGISTIFHSLKRKEKIDDDSINFNKISEDYSIENMQHRIDEQQADKDDEDSEENDSDEDINDNTENANLSSSSDNEVKTPSAKPAPEPITFEYALENVDNEVSQPEQKEQENNEEGNSTDSSHTSNNVTTHHHDFVSADFEAIPARYRISKGQNILCTLKNKIDTSYPGIATCVIAKPVFSDDGTTILIERGSIVIGKQAGGLSGTHRAFINWTEIKTPHDITIKISAPVSDSLGAAGINGKINYQLLKKFFLSTAISVIETGENYLVEKAKKPRSAVVNLDSSNEIPMPQQFDELYKSMNEELIEKKTLVVNPGTQINVQLNQDLDFSKVYKNE